MFIQLQLPKASLIQKLPKWTAHFFQSPHLLQCTKMDRVGVNQRNLLKDFIVYSVLQIDRLIKIKLLNLYK